MQGYYLFVGDFESILRLIRDGRGHFKMNCSEAMNFFLWKRSDVIRKIYDANLQALLHTCPPASQELTSS